MKYPLFDAQKDFKGVQRSLSLSGSPPRDKDLLTRQDDDNFSEEKGLSNLIRLADE